MKRSGLLPFVLLGLAGCTTPLTERLDRANQQMAVVIGQLDEADRELARANQKLEDIERTLKHFPGLGQNQDYPADPLARHPEPSPPLADPVIDANPANIAARTP
jgi:hypothetical protein